MLSSTFIAKSESTESLFPGAKASSQAGWSTGMPPDSQTDPETDPQRGMQERPQASRKAGMPECA